MKRIYLTVAILVILSVAACSTAYRNSQTPDDVYHSPARLEETAIIHERSSNEPIQEYYPDRTIWMSIYDRRWRNFNDDYDHYYSPYHFGYTYGYYYNPFYCTYPVYINNVTIKNPKNTVPRMTNLGSYNNATYSISSVKARNGQWIYIPKSNTYPEKNQIRIRQILTEPSREREYNPSNNNNRTYSPSTNSSSTSGGSPVQRPSRAN